jgi:hypothetical protein
MERGRAAEAETTLNGGLDIRFACVGGFLEAEGGDDAGSKDS